MKHRHWPKLAVVACAAAACGAAAASATATPGPAAAATAYLQARSAAVTAADPGAVLATCTTPAGKLAATERTIARGMALRAAQLDHHIDSVGSDIVVLDTVVGMTRDTATVSAHVITTIVWHATSGEPSTEASGVDHTVSLQRVGDTWQVVGDSYLDVGVPSYLEAAGASPAMVRQAVRRLERHTALPIAAASDKGRARVAPAARVHGYSDILTYDREAAAGYADRYALSYNPAYVRFGADCADFASQGARAGGMPVNAGDYNSGWWYDKKGTASVSDDRYSLSWINVTQQMNYWNGRRTDWVTSIGALGRGDFVYYDCIRLRVQSRLIRCNTVSKMSDCARLGRSIRALRTGHPLARVPPRAPSQRAIASVSIRVYNYRIRQRKGSGVSRSRVLLRVDTQAVD